MKKTNLFRSVLSFVLAVMMVVSVPMTVFAETVTTEEKDNADGTHTVLTTTTTTEKTGDKTTVTVKIEEATDGTTDDGTKIDRDVTSTNTKVDTPAYTQTSSTEVGTEKKEYTEEVKPGEEVPDLNLDFDPQNPGQTVTDSVTGDTVKEPTTGDQPTGEDDKNYDYTEKESTVDREASGSLNVEENFVIDPEKSEVHCPVAPEDYEGKDYYDFSDDKCDPKDPNKYDTHYREGLLPGYDKDYLSGIDGKPEGDGYDQGYDMTWTGYGDITDGATAVFGYVEEGKDPYLRDENGEIVTEYGVPVYNMENITFISMGSKMPNDPLTDYKGTGMFTQPVMFALKHENGEYFYAYCMDVSTGASPTKNTWYNIKNLEDVIESEENPDGYINEEEAGMIRAIANSGYWGTESGKGSVESLKQMLRDFYKEDDEVNVRYQGSNDAIAKNVYELIDGLTEAEALAVTQAAIWALANKDDAIGMNANVISVLSASKYHNGTHPETNGFLSQARPAKDIESDARMRALYLCLMNLDPVYAENEYRSDSVVIPNSGAVTDVGIVIKDKVEGNAKNENDNADDDVYNTDLTFQLAFVPGDKDEMYVVLMQGDEIITDANGDPIKKLLASENSKKDGDDVIKPVDGVYTLTGLTLGENSDFVFDLKLEGTQYLENGVYVYQTAGGRDASQTLVGLAEGSQHVESTTTLTINFEVNEKKNVVAVRKWSKTTDPKTTNKGGTFRMTNPGPGGETEIPDEEVPLADAPETGDASLIYGVMSAISGMGLAALNITGNGKKKSGKYQKA